ncbi:MAG TPA: hypothetical protein VMT16_11655 [Thermoanaerobaculia bacterium]|nr:hypothetical protein [Thermoanaerobaculia bacterium]
MAALAVLYEQPASDVAQPAAGPGETSAGTQKLAAGGDGAQGLGLPAGTVALAVAVESSPPVPLALALVDPSGNILATAEGAAGSSVLEAPAAAGPYVVQVLNLGLQAVEVWTLATPLVARDDSAAP